MLAPLPWQFWRVRGNKYMYKGLSVIFSQRATDLLYLIFYCEATAKWHDMIQPDQHIAWSCKCNTQQNAINVRHLLSYLLQSVLEAGHRTKKYSTSKKRRSHDRNITNMLNIPGEFFSHSHAAPLRNVSIRFALQCMSENSFSVCCQLKKVSASRKCICHCNTSHVNINSAGIWHLVELISHLLQHYNNILHYHFFFFL